MALTVREICLQRLKARLEACPSGYPVTRNPADDFDPASFPALGQVDGGHLVAFRVHGQTDYTLEATVFLFVAQGVTDGEALNAVYGEVVAAIWADRTLGDLVTDLREVSMGQPEPVLEDEDGNLLTTPYLVAELSLAMDFATVEGDPYTSSGNISGGP